MISSQGAAAVRHRAPELSLALIAGELSLLRLTELAWSILTFECFATLDYWGGEPNRRMVS